MGVPPPGVTPRLLCTASGWGEAGVTSVIFAGDPLVARIDPEVQGTVVLYERFHGAEPPAAATAPVLAPLVSTFVPTLQGAGPNLTREAWSEALRAGDQTENAISQPSLNWGDDTVWGYENWLGIDDFTEIWWDPDMVGLDEVRREGGGSPEWVGPRSVGR